MSVSQDQFRHAVLDPDLAVPDGLHDGQNRPAGKRFSVYRNNVVVSLTEALAAGFPVIAKLLGPTNFPAVMGEFLRLNPPRSPLMIEYGADLPDFLASFPPLAHLEYLPDVARLELALRRSYHARDAAPINPDILQTMSSDTLLAARLTLAPTVEVLQSKWPIHAIWQFNTNGGPAPVATAQTVLITRPGFDPQMTQLDTATTQFIEKIRNGETFGDAHQAAQDKNDAFDLGGVLATLLTAQAIINIE